MVGYRGEKMSKSKGNLVFVSKLRELGVDPMAVRLALLAHHYRSDWEWTDADLQRAEESLASLRAAVEEPEGAATSALVPAVRQALADDLNAPLALSALQRWALATNEGVGWSTPGSGCCSDPPTTVAPGCRLRRPGHTDVGAQSSPESRRLR
jgi:L-cysteine:1D-myo-inositol 2-amino-2-deoxy-alpha-D-glucopyranoside ligase